jgi:hypothetical protein
MYTIELVKNKFWILEDAGVKVGLIRRVNENCFDLYGTRVWEDPRNVSLSSLEEQFGKGILTPKEIVKSISVDYGETLTDVLGYPAKHAAHNVKHIEVKGKQVPTYTKSASSEVRYAAGYYGLQFASMWKNAYCVKLGTLDEYNFIGPFKTTTELEAEVLLKNRENE